MPTIDGLGGPARISLAGRGAAVPVRSGFSVSPEPAAAGAATAAGSAPTSASMAAMLSLQELDPERMRDRPGRRHGRSLLAALSALQRAVLTDQPGGAGQALAQLAALLADMPPVFDPGLADVLSAIRLRATVELARAEH
jgi:hypothetical protein